MKASNQNLLFITLVSLGAFGCQHPQPPQLTQTDTSYRFYRGPNTAPPKPARSHDDVAALQAGAVFMQAHPKMPLAVPMYPDIPVSERRNWVTVGVHLNIDTNGNVTDITPSLVCISTPHPRSDAYFEAVKSAVAQWRFFFGKIAAHGNDNRHRRQHLVARQARRKS